MTVDEALGMTAVEVTLRWFDNRWREHLDGRRKLGNARQIKRLVEELRRLRARVEDLETQLFCADAELEQYR
jgi:hypothetical protein